MRIPAPLVLAAVCACGLAAVAGAAGARAAGTTGQSAQVDPAERIERQLAEADDAERSVTDISPPPPVTATGWLVYDARADEPVAGVEAATPRPIASLAKLMTALVVTDRVQPDELVTIPAAVNDLPADASRMDAKPGEKWTAGDLLQAMLVYSANDAAVALASHVGDGDVEAFVKLMNERAEELGLASTEFASPTGLDTPGASNTSTPIDLVALATAALEEPDIAAAVATKKLELERPGAKAGEKPIVLLNRNPLLGTYTGVDGIKTGFTDAAGYMLVVHDTDEDTGGELVVATFASKSAPARVADMTALLDWARTLRSELTIVEGGTPLGSIPVQHSDERVEVFACDDLVVSARVGEHVAQDVVVPRSLQAPVREGDEVGELRARVGVNATGEEVTAPSVPVCAGSSVAEHSRTERVRDRASDYRAAWSAGVDEVEDRWSSFRERVA